MSLHHNNNLDSLIQQALQAKVANKYPPERVWKRLSKKIKPKQNGYYFRIWQVSLVLQLAFVLMFVVSTDIGFLPKSLLTSPAEIASRLVNNTPTPNSVYVIMPVIMDVNEEVIIIEPDAFEMHLLKIQARLLQNESHSKYDQSDNAPLFIPPTDMIPRVIYDSDSVQTKADDVPLFIPPIDVAPHPMSLTTDLSQTNNPSKQPVIYIRYQKQTVREVMPSDSSEYNSKQTNFN